MSEVFERIRKIVEDHDVVVFGKGSVGAPRCGFTSVVFNILDSVGVKFFCVDILEDEELRASLREFSDWPTFPQIYVKGEFIGGCDILRTMFASGELEKLLKDKEVS